MRITKAILETKGKVCQRVAPVNGWTYSIDWAYSSPRLVRVDSRLCCQDVSPRLPSGQLATWIDAFIAGAETAIRKG